MLGRGFIIITTVFFAFMLNDAAASPFYRSDYVDWNSSRICSPNYGWSREGICEWVGSKSDVSCGTMGVELIDDDDDDDFYNDFDVETLSIYLDTILICRNSEGVLKGCACAGKGENGVIKFKGKTYKSDGVTKEKCYDPGKEKTLASMESKNKKEENISSTITIISTFVVENFKLGFGKGLTLMENGI